MENQKDTALYIFPTKALAQDQLRSLKQLLEAHEALAKIEVSTFDGDTPWKERDSIRSSCRILFVNPDILHSTILPRHAEWRLFLENMKFIVLDEMHMYRFRATPGTEDTTALGVHTSFVLRRLLRVCDRVYNNRSVQLVACSATLDSPIALFQQIFGSVVAGAPVHLVDGAADTSGNGEKTLAIWKNTGDDHFCLLKRCAQLVIEACCAGLRTIAFCKVKLTPNLDRLDVSPEKIASSLCEQLWKASKPQTLARK